RTRPLDANVRRPGRVVVVLNRASRNRDFRVGAAGTVDEHIGGWFALHALVALDVAAGDLEVPHLAGLHHNPAAVAVADVAAGHVDLVQVDAFEEQADAAILVDVAVRDDDVAVAPREVNAVPALADEDARDGELHRAAGLDGVGLLVVADDLESLDDGH